MRAAVAALLFVGVLGFLQARGAGQRQMRATIDTAPSSRAEVLASSDALPAHIAAALGDPAAFVESTSGRYLVFDRRAQAIYAIDRGATTATRIVQIGEERGRIIRPTAFAAEPGGSFVVADQPGPNIRIQRFAGRGYLLNGFTVAPQPGPPLVVAGLAVAGVGSLQYTGDSIFLSRPNSGSLITEYSWNGHVRRAFGVLRRTGQESDAAVHLSLNAGLPLVDPAGGFYFVFQTGIPAFRKYDAAGELVFERHIEGRELDDTLRSLPAVWPHREGSAEWPAVPLVVRAATVDPLGRLWVALANSFVYVYSTDGDKIRTLQLRAAGPLAPTSLFFSSSFRLLVTPGCYIFQPESR